MPSRRTCHHPTDIKSVCPHCGKRVFAARTSYPTKYLSCWNCRQDIGPLDLSKEWSFGDPDAPEPVHIFDIIYEGDTKIEEVREIANAYPSALVEREYDEIHGYRTTVDLKNVPVKDYLKTIIKLGFGGISFSVQMSLRDKDDSRWAIALKEALKELEQEGAFHPASES